MSDKIATLNTLADTGNIKARGFDDQDEALKWINENITNPKYILWKGNATQLQFPLQAMDFFISIFGSIQNSLIKDHSIGKELEIPADVSARDGHALFTWGATSLYEYLDRPQFIIAYKQIN